MTSTNTRTPKIDLALRLAVHLLTLPAGAWPETTEAQAQLTDALPGEMTLDGILEVAARRAKHVHSSRMPWLEAKGRRYAMTDAPRIYPALAASYAAFVG